MDCSLLGIRNRNILSGCHGANGNGNNGGDGWATVSVQSSEDSGSTNTPPEASSVSYVPPEPTKETGLSVSYNYYDADGDFEQGTSIHWFRDGLRVTQIDDLTDVPNSLISKGKAGELSLPPMMVTNLEILFLWIQ